ncbi:MAG: alkaline phosphatase family protein, partial [Caldimonas sp.]
ADSWFTYYHFLDDSRAPDFARTVEIHRKPGYDPAELFFDRKIAFPKLAVATRLVKKLAGLRTLMDVIGLDATVVRGSHGRPTDRAEDGPLFITSAPELLADGPVPAVAVKQLLLDHVFGVEA